MSPNRGKQFENVIREAFEKVHNVSVDRLHDQTTGFKGSQNICDFIVYREPYEYYIECKSVHGPRLSIHSNDPKKMYGAITNTQWEGLLEKSKIQGVTAGIICWWIDYDVTKFIPIRDLIIARQCGYKSIRYDTECYTAHTTDELGYRSQSFELVGKKKRVFFEYSMEEFFNEFN